MKSARGFTLVELMIVLVIGGIIGSIAYPGYARYVTRSRRVEGQLALLDALQQQERFYSRNNTYVEFSADSSEPDAQRFKWWSGSVAAGSAYELRGGACTGHDITECVEVRAMPGTERVDRKFRDSECETLSLNSIGQHNASGTSTRCWP